MLSSTLRGHSALLRALQPSSISQGGTAGNILSRYVRRYADDSGKDTLAARFWESIRGKTKQEGRAESGAAEQSSGNDLVPSLPELRHREVFAVPLTRKPLFPGTLMPVQVQDQRLINEIIELKRDGAQAYVGAFLQREPGQTSTSEASFSGHPGVPEADGTGAAEAGKATGAAQPEHGPENAADALHSIGTFAQVHTIMPGESGAMMLLVGHRRLKRLRTVNGSPLKVEVEHLRRKDFDRRDDHLRATVMEIVSTLKELLVMHPLYNEQLKSFANIGGDFHNPDKLADMAASLTSADEDALQAILEELSVPDRASAALLLLKKEVELCKLQVDIGKRVEEKISKDQRRYFLTEQLRSIKRELGMEKDDKSAVVQKFQERVEPIREQLPEEAKKVIDDELSKLAGLEQASAEFNVTRNYLDWLTSLPWGQYSDERLDLDLAKRVLDEDHYGLDDVKERILEFIAVGKLRGNTVGKILCLVGPPGVGKTSIGKSIARALDRKYYRFSVGGLSDVAEIKGHRRTYVGAMPGKIVQCLKSTGTSNPLVLIDEIDKLGRGWQGDPASALLELLDPEQNRTFLDHYLDVPVDLSKVLFVVTANVLDTIPGPLLDRMEVLRISGYIADEKVHIARKYLEPQTRGEAGIAEGDSSVTDAALNTLITEYCREAGVRNLKKHLEKIYRKVALKLVQRSANQPAKPLVGSTASDGSPEVASAAALEGTAGADGGVAAADLPAADSGSITVEEGELADYVGQPPFTSDRIYEVTPPGVVMGLAWSAQGGNSLYIEAASVERGEGKGSLKTTGQLGDVMKESATIAHTFSRAFLLEHVPQAPPSFFSENAIHIHVPAGATPKDGPSAGCAIITSLLSLALNKPVRPDLAMTGEVTLTGRVLPIGGVKEKTLAARRSGIRMLIFPEGNRKDYEELSDDVKEGLTAHFVDKYKEVFDLALQYQASEVSAHHPASETALQQ